jgi:phosphoribosyl 1,2-cyclic phosphodiesterase
VKVRVWGTRGSLAAPGPETVRYGGNTSCVEVRAVDDAVVVLDAGTGIARLGATVGPEVARVDILLTHLHMDHLQGLGFFAPLFRPGLEVHLWGPASTTLDLRARLSRYLSPPLFPVRLRDLPCRLSLHDVPFGPFELPGLAAMSDLVCHPGPTVGYRLTDGRVSMAYLPDHEIGLGACRFPAEPRWTSGYDLAHGVDLLIHDAQYSPTEYTAHVGWGHSSIADAIAFAVAAKVRRLLVFHHDPSRDDEAIERLVREARASLPHSVEVAPAAEGVTFELD